MPRLVIHIGVGKTGSTLWQKNLFPCHPEIKYLGGVRADTETADDRLRRNCHRLLRAIISSDSLLFDTDYWVRFYSQDIVPYLSHGRVNVLSDEWLTLTPICLVRSDRGLIAERLRTVFGGDTTIVLFLRNQLDVFDSIFHNHLTLFLRQYCRDRLLIPHRFIRKEHFFEMLLQTADYGVMSKYLYLSLVQTYQNLFGDSLLVVLYEQFAENNEKTIDELSKKLGISAAPFKEGLPAERVNATNTWRKNERWNSSLPAALYFKRTGASNDVFAANHLKLGQKDLPHLVGLLQDYYRDNNMKVSELLKIELRSFGYAV